MHNIIQKMGMLFLIMMTGYIGNKAGVLDDEGNKKFSSLVVNITAPAIILASSADADSLGSKKDALVVLLVATLMYAFLAFAALFVRKLFRLEKGSEGIYRFMTIFGNNAFMGYPVVQAVFGDNALFYAAIFNLPNNILAYSYGIWLLTSGRSKTGHFQWKNVCNPGVISAVTTLLLFLCGIKLPSFAVDTLECVGNITTPMAMLVIGSSLANIPIRSVVKSIRIYLFSLWKLLFLPFLIWLIANPILQNKIVLGVLVVIAAMPCATIAVMLSNEYGGDAETASKYVFMSTVLSVITIPLVTFFLLYI